MYRVVLLKLANVTPLDEKYSKTSKGHHQPVTILQSY